MAKLIYSTITSLDGYIEDRDGRFDWAEPDGEVHTFINELERMAGTYLYGRRMYEVMTAWETLPLAGQPSFMRDYAEVWRAADKVVYSRTLTETPTAKTRIERDFDPDVVREMKSSTASDILIGGPELATHAIKAGLVDEHRLFLAPVVVGGGNGPSPTMSS